MSTPDPAIPRFWALQGARFGGVAMVLLGMTGFAENGYVSEAQGGVLIAGGLAMFFALPILLARHWKSKE